MLVADYGTSDEEFEEEPTSSTSSAPKKVIPPPTSSSTSFFEDSSEEEEEDSSKLGQFLPKPRDKKGEEVADIGPIPPKKVYGDEELLKPPAAAPPVSFHNLTTKKVKGVVRIAAPSLKDFEDEEPSSSKRFIEAPKKGSGLFAILPQPRAAILAAQLPASYLKKPNVLAPAQVSSSSSSASSSSLPKSLIPDSVKNLGKRPPPSKLEEIRAKYLKQDANVRIVSKGKISASSTVTKKVQESDEDSSEDEEAPNFFSFDSGEKIDDETLEKLKLPTPDFSMPSSSSAVEEPEEEEENQGVISAGPVPQEDFMKYIKKGKGGVVPEVNFIDISAKDLRPDSTEWIKNITDESAIPIRRGKGLGGMQKRKHQITYLAVEAKAREQELQAQWAQNRQTRRQTQMKYGF